MLFENGEDDFPSSSFGFHPCQMQCIYIVQGWNPNFGLQASHMICDDLWCLYFRAIGQRGTELPAFYLRYQGNQETISTKLDIYSVHLYITVSVGSLSNQSLQQLVNDHPYVGGVRYGTVRIMVKPFSKPGGHVWMGSQRRPGDQSLSVIQGFAGWLSYSYRSPQCLVLYIYIYHYVIIYTYI